MFLEYMIFFKSNRFVMKNLLQLNNRIIFVSYSPCVAILVSEVVQRLPTRIILAAIIILKGLNIILGTLRIIVFRLKFLASYSV